MANLTQFEQVVQEHICLYVYSVRLNKFRIFNDVRLVKNIMFPNNPLYYIHYYPGSDGATEYIVSPNAGEVQHSNGGVFKVWLTEANDSAGAKLLLDAIKKKIDERIKAASNTISTMKKQKETSHDTLDVLVKFKKSS